MFAALKMQLLDWRKSCAKMGSVKCDCWIEVVAQPEAAGIFDAIPPLC